LTDLPTVGKSELSVKGTRSPSSFRGPASGANTSSNSGGADSYWYRGYPDSPPEALIVVGFSPDALSRVFASCDVAGQVSNQYGVKNEETSRSQIYVCRDPVRAWPELWPMLRAFQ
jgi:hypothetical protein